MNKKRILLVDDEPDFLLMLTYRLKAYGYAIVTAANGKEALEVIQDKSPDAILLDIQMPEMDGFEVLKAVRKQDKNLPIFILTTFSDERRQEESKRLGASGFMVKGNFSEENADDLIAAIRASQEHCSSDV